MTWSRPTCLATRAFSAARAIALGAAVSFCLISTKDE